MRFVYPVFLLSLLLLSGCTNPAQQNQPDVYYDVLTYVKGQITDLSARKPLTSKTVAINKKRNQQTTHEINWSRELELFTQADINKPALRSSYQVSRPDSLTYQYTLKNSEERLTVRSLMVRLDSTTRKPGRIEAVLQTRNPLYASERHLVLNSGPTAGKQWGLQEYTVSGFQKLPLFDKNEFFVNGKVLR
ncbi:hypothetical protein [Spirosoma linguale]|uniref:Lipoprotein n=1 Tax=Spirosoma linguale (strain ATCC 33905 / DSM 74 / LMG 10896 / Claus 1) TaxID=504472 RepID=D2QT64_SPILD|nr:hypothetical protein Slin_6034 [Spirosoma linguale DSM 74]